MLSNKYKITHLLDPKDIIVEIKDKASSNFETNIKIDYVDCGSYISYVLGPNIPSQEDILWNCLVFSDNTIGFTDRDYTIETIKITFL